MSWQKREKVCGVCVCIEEERLCVLYEPSDVILLVICPETRGEILLRCRCSVKFYTAGKILLMCHILWKSPKSVFLPTELEGEREEHTLKYIWKKSMKLFATARTQRGNKSISTILDMLLQCANLLSPVYRNQTEPPSRNQWSAPRNSTVKFKPEIFCNNSGGPCMESTWSLEAKIKWMDVCWFTFSSIKSVNHLIVGAFSLIYSPKERKKREEMTLKFSVIITSILSFALQLDLLRQSPQCFFWKPINHRENMEGLFTSARLVNKKRAALTNTERTADNNFPSKRLTSCWTRSSSYGFRKQPWILRYTCWNIRS